MAETIELNRYVALFEGALERNLSVDRNSLVGDFINQLLQRLNAKLSIEGRSAESIEREMRTASEAARIAERNVRRRLSEEHLPDLRGMEGTVVPEATQSATRRHIRTGILFLLSFISVAAYCAVNIMFAFEHRHAPVVTPSNAPHTALTIDVSVADFNNQKLLLHLLPVGGEFVGKDGKLTKDIKVKVEGGDGFIEHRFLAHSVLPPMAAEVEIDSGDILNYPFDQYQAEIDIEATVDGMMIPIRTILDDVPHNLKVSMVEDSTNPADVGDILSLSRSNIELFVILLSVASLLVVVICSMWVAVHVVLNHREISFDVLVWTAALLFVIPTMRDTLPGDPPYGSAIDFMVFFWLQAAVAVATIILVWAWVRRSGDTASA